MFLGIWYLYKTQHLNWHYFCLTVSIKWFMAYFQLWLQLFYHCKQKYIIWLYERPCSKCEINFIVALNHTVAILAEWALNYEEWIWLSNFVVLGMCPMATTTQCLQDFPECRFDSQCFGTLKCCQTLNGCKTCQVPQMIRVD